MGLGFSIGLYDRHNKKLFIFTEEPDDLKETTFKKIDEIKKKVTDLTKGKKD